MLLLVLALLCSVSVRAQQESAQQESKPDSVDRMAEDFVTTSICIADPTDWHDDAMGVLGHAFIRLQCPHFNLDNSFSYETEDPYEDKMKFFTGKLAMRMVRVPTKEYIKSYERWHRAVHEYVLNLPPQVETELWRIMDKATEKDDDLHLDLMRHGCTQTLVEYVEQALGTIPIEYGPWPEEYQLSRREIINNVLAPYPWQRFLFHDMLFDNDFNADVDNESKIIYPRQLVEVWQKAKVEDRVLATYAGDIVKAPAVEEEETFFTPMLFAVILLVLTIALAFTRTTCLDWTMLTVQFLVGLILCWLVLFSNLPGTKGVYLLPLYNPLPLLLWKWRKHWAVPYAGLLLVWAIAICVVPDIYVDKAHLVICAAYIVMLLKPLLKQKIGKKNG